MSDAVLIPLYARDGSIREYAVVDAEDVERLNTRRWQFNGRYAVRGFMYEGKYRAGLMHRAVMDLDMEDPHEVDHLNGDGLDNRKINLAVVTHAENLGNQRAQSGRASRHRGVRRHKNGWSALVKTNGKVTQLGVFAREDDAAAAVRDWWASRLPHLARGVPALIDRTGLPMVEAPTKNHHAQKAANPDDLIVGEDESGPFIGLPLYSQGNTVRAHALIDPPDMETVGQHRWFYVERGRNRRYPYAIRSVFVDGRWKPIAMHREVIGLPRFDSALISHHVNRNTLDNRKANLRAITWAEMAKLRRSEKGAGHE